MIILTIAGRIAKDAESGETKNGKAFARFTVLWDKPKAKEGARANDFRVELYGREGLHEYLKAGAPIAVTGRVETGSYEKDGVKHYTRTLVASEVELLPEGKMAGFSNITVIGNLTQDASSSYLPNDANTCVTTFTVAVNRPWDRDKADFFPVTLYGKRGESLGRYLVMGKKVAIVGHIETNSFKKSDGTTGYSWRVLPSSDENGINLLGGKKKAEMSSNDHEEPAAATAAPEEEVGFTELPPEIDDGYFDF